MPPEHPRKWVRVSHAAQILGVSRETLMSMTDAGILTCWRPTPTSHRRWDAAELDRQRLQAGAAA